MTRACYGLWHSRSEPAALRAGQYSILAWTALAVRGCMGLFAVALYQVFDRTEAAIGASLVAMAQLLTLGLEAVMLGVELGPLQGAGFVLVLAAIVALARRA